MYIYTSNIFYIYREAQSIILLRKTHTRTHTHSLILCQFKWKYIFLIIWVFNCTLHNRICAFDWLVSMRRVVCRSSNNATLRKFSVIKKWGSPMVHILFAHCHCHCQWMCLWVSVFVAMRIYCTSIRVFGVRMCMCASTLHFIHKWISLRTTNGTIYILYEFSYNNTFLSIVILHILYGSGTVMCVMSQKSTILLL